MYAVLSFTSEVPERLEEGEIVGIDRGIYYMAISSDGKHYRSDEIRKAKRRYAYDRKTLQAKGTRSARLSLIYGYSSITTTTCLSLLSRTIASKISNRSLILRT